MTGPAPAPENHAVLKVARSRARQLLRAETAVTAVTAVTSAALGSQALLWSGQPIDVRWTVDTDNRNRVGTHESRAEQMGFSLEIHNKDYI